MYNPMYDDWLRVWSENWTGGAAEENLSRTNRYDAPGRWVAREEGTGGGASLARVDRVYDGYGQAVQEQVWTGSGSGLALYSDVRQSWDGEGRRSEWASGASWLQQGAGWGNRSQGSDYSMAWDLTFPACLGTNGEVWRWRFSWCPTGTGWKST